MTSTPGQESGERIATALVKNGQVVRSALIIIHLWPREVDCALCDTVGDHRYAIGWCCGPTKDEIGSESSEYPGHIVGGMTVCKPCHDSFYAPPSSADSSKDGGDGR